MIMKNSDNKDKNVNDNNNNNSNNNSNNNNSKPETRKYLIEVQWGIVLSHGVKNPL